MILTGKVVVGQKIAKKKGIATANLQVLSSDLLADGVYAVDCFLAEEKFRGILHYGRRLTVDNKFTAEVHLFDFSRDIYGAELQIKVCQKIREIKKFSSVEALFKQIKTDIIRAKKYFCRREIREKWATISAKSREKMAEQAVWQIAKNDDFLRAENVFIYAPKDDEINFVPSLCQQFPHKNYFFPKIEKNEMNFFRAKFSDLKVGKWGILEPVSEAEKAEKLPDLIFFPAVGAAQKGYRLGNGGGFYDRFFAGFSVDELAKIPKICVLPKFAILPEIPTEEHDLSVDEVLEVNS